MKKGGLEGSKKRANGDPNDDVNPSQSSGGQAVRPRGHKSSAQDVKREAAQAQLEETLKTLITGKEESTAARYMEKRKDKEEAMARYVEMTRKKLEIEQEKIKAEENRVRLALLAEENRIMMADLTIMDPEQRAWFLKKQKMIHEHEDM